MSDESEEACLVNPRSPSLSGIPIGGMPYTDGNTMSSGLMNQLSNRRESGVNNSGGSGIGNNSSGRSNNTTTGGGVGSGLCSSGGGGGGGSGSHLSHESESGELIDYNDEILFSQFHSDAIKQAGCGKFQIIATIITGLGLAGHAIQVYAVFYIMPSAEIEFCILDNEKNWLGNITLLGLGIGALFWGGLAGRTGRRKTLLSCLGVSGVFSVIAAFMPTYGPFMMARFCAAAGIGGALPSASVYLCELTPVNRRARVVSLLGACGIAGGIIAGCIAIMTVPLTGQEVILENKEHFSAWHRYLLIITLPTLAAILGLFWLPESPRYLLENCREVECLSIYQKIYRSNRSRGGYALTELELPGSRNHRNTAPASVLAGMAHSINMFCGAFLQLLKKKHFRITCLLFISWSCAIFVCHGFTIYITEHSKTIEADAYDKDTVTKFNVTYENVNFNSSFDNVIYNQCRFFNCTFRRMFLSHVNFNNCTFEDTEFANVKTSRAIFKDSLLSEIRLIDTDLTERHFINCIKNNITIIRLLGACDRDFEYNIFFDALVRSNLGALIPALILMCVIGEVIHNMGRSRVAAFCFTTSMLLMIIFGLVQQYQLVIWTGGTAQAFLLAGLIALTLICIETYSTTLRCTALGVIICGGHLGALISIPIYSALPMATTKLAAIISTFTMIVPIAASMVLKDPCSLL